MRAARNFFQLFVENSPAAILWGRRRHRKNTPPPPVVSNRLLAYPPPPLSEATSFMDDPLSRGSVICILQWRKKRKKINKSKISLFVLTFLVLISTVRVVLLTAAITIFLKNLSGFCCRVVIIQERSLIKRFLIQVLLYFSKKIKNKKQFYPIIYTIIEAKNHRTFTNWSLNSF